MFASLGHQKFLIAVLGLGAFMAMSSLMLMIHARPQPAASRPVVLSAVTTVPGVEGETVGPEYVGEYRLSQSQLAAGEAFVVEEVELLQPAFVVMHATADGQLGEILGYSQVLPAGVVNGVAVTSTRWVSAGETVALLLYKDNGDGELTDADQPALTAAGEWAQLWLTVTE